MHTMMFFLLNDILSNLLTLIGTIGQSAITHRPVFKVREKGFVLFQIIMRREF